jgi:hypothetical protein
MGSGDVAPLFMTSALDLGEWSASRFTPGERAPTTQKEVKVMLRPTVQSASLSWNKAPIWGLRPELYYCQTVAGLLMWGALSNERTGLSFARLSSNKPVVSMYNLHVTSY